jgi:hypothetical protein
VSRRFQVRSREDNGRWLHEVFDATTGETVLDPHPELSWCFDAAAMLESGLAVGEALELLAVRPVSKKCGC